MDDRYRTGRLVLRDGAGEVEAEGFAGELAWPRLEEYPAVPEELQPREVTWGIGPNAVMHYIEDVISGYCWVTFSGFNPETLLDIREAAILALPVRTEDEIISGYDRATTPDALVSATYLAGIAAPESFEERFFQRVERSLASGATQVRQAALWATTYSAWPEFRPALALIAHHDPDPARRQDAAFVLEAFDAVEGQQ